MVSFAAFTVTAVATAIEAPIETRVPYLIREAFGNVLAIAAVEKNFMNIKEVRILRVRLN